MAVNKKNTASVYLFSFFALIAAFSPLFATGLINAGYEPDFSINSFFQVGFLCIIIGYCWQLTQRKKNHSITISYLAIALWLLFLLATLALFFAIVLYEAWIKWLYWWSAILAFFLAQQLICSHQRIERLMQFYLVSGCMIALIGISQYYSAITWLPQAQPPASVFVNKNFAAQYIIYILPLACYFFITREKHFYLYAITLAILITFILFAHSRSAFIAASLQFFALFTWLLIQSVYQKKHYIKRRHGYALGGIILGVLLFSSISPTGDFSFSLFALLQDDIQRIAGEASTAYQQGNIRLAMWANTLLMFKEHWLWGLGLGQWNVLYPLYHQKTLLDWNIGAYIISGNAHNDYLEYATELGIFGIALALFLIIILLRTLHQNRTSLLFCTITTVFIGAATVMFFSFPAQKPTLLVHLFIYCAILSKYQPSIYTLHFNQTMIWLKIMAASIGLIYALHTSYVLYYATDNYYRMYAAALTKDKNAIITYAQRSLEWLPYRHEVFYYLGSAYRGHRQHPMALEYFDKMLNTYPYHIPTLNKAYKSALALKQYDRAKDYLQRLVLITPYNAEVHKSLGILYNNQYQQYQAAHYHLQQALKLNPNIENAAKIRQVIEQYEYQLKSPLKEEEN